MELEWAEISVFTCLCRRCSCCHWSPPQLLVIAAAAVFAPDAGVAD